MEPSATSAYEDLPELANLFSNDAEMAAIDTFANDNESNSATSDQASGDATASMPEQSTRNAVASVPNHANGEVLASRKGHLAQNTSTFIPNQATGSTTTFMPNQSTQNASAVILNPEIREAIFSLREQLSRDFPNVPAMAAQILKMVVEAMAENPTATIEDYDQTVRHIRAGMLGHQRKRQLRMNHRNILDLASDDSQNGNLEVANPSNPTSTPSHPSLPAKSHKSKTGKGKERADLPPAVTRGGNRLAKHALTTMARETKSEDPQTEPQQRAEREKRADPPPLGTTGNGPAPPTTAKGTKRRRLPMEFHGRAKRFQESRDLQAQQQLTNAYSSPTMLNQMPNPCNPQFFSLPVSPPGPLAPPQSYMSNPGVPSPVFPNPHMQGQGMQYIGIPNTSMPGSGTQDQGIPNSAIFYPGLPDPAMLHPGMQFQGFVNQDFSNSGLPPALRPQFLHPPNQCPPPQYPPDQLLPTYTYPNIPTDIETVLSPLDTPTPTPIHPLINQPQFLTQRNLTPFLSEHGTVLESYWPPLHQNYDLCFQTQSPWTPADNQSPISRLPTVVENAGVPSRALLGGETGGYLGMERRGRAEIRGERWVLRYDDDGGIGEGKEKNGNANDMGYGNEKEKGKEKKKNGNVNDNNNANVIASASATANINGYGSGGMPVQDSGIDEEALAELLGRAIERIDANDDDSANDNNNGTSTSSSTIIGNGNVSESGNVNEETGEGQTADWIDRTWSDWRGRRVQGQPGRGQIRT